MLIDRMTTTVIASASGDEAGVAAATGLRLMGYSIKEMAAGVATLSLLNGASSGGTALVHVNLAAAGSTVQWFGPQGIPADSGIWVERLTGSTAVILYSKIVT